MFFIYIVFFSKYMLEGMLFKIIGVNALIIAIVMERISANHPACFTLLLFFWEFIYILVNIVSTKILLNSILAEQLLWSLSNSIGNFLSAIGNLVSTLRVYTYGSWSLSVLIGVTLFKSYFKSRNTCFQVIPNNFWL